MTQTKAGAQKAAETNKRKYGDGFYKNIGSRGGKACVPKGFAVNPELAKIAGARGGRISRRGPAKKHLEIIKADSEEQAIEVKTNN